MGTTNLDATQDLLALLDSAAEEIGIRHNGAILRRALKSRFNSDFRLQKWEAMNNNYIQPHQNPIHC